MVRGGLFLFSNAEARQETKSLECQHFEVSALTKWLISINKNIDLGPTKVSNCLEQLCLSRERPKMGNVSRTRPCNSRY